MNKLFLLLVIILIGLFISCNTDLSEQGRILSDYFISLWGGNFDTVKIEFKAPHANHDIKKAELWLNVNPCELIDDVNTHFSLEVIDGAGMSYKIDATDGFAPNGIDRYIDDSENAHRWKVTLTDYGNLLLLKISRENVDSMPLNTSAASDITWTLEIDTALSTNSLQNIIGNIYNFNFAVDYIFIENGERVYFTDMSL